MPAFAGRFEKLPAYPLAEVPAIKRELRARGVDLIDLGVGDADLPPPPAARDALVAASADPANSRYSFQLGLVRFREEIAAWMERRFDVAIDSMREILPLLGSKEGLFHLPLAYLQPGDVAIIPDPGYQAYIGGTILAGGEPYLYPLTPDNDFLVQPRDLPDDVVARAKLMYLNYPNNPTTAVAPRPYLEEVVDFCRAHDILLVYDNAYSEIAFDGYVPPSVLEIEDAREVCIEFHSLSKTYNMTGWRVGWAAGGAAHVGALQRLKTFADTGVPFLMQHAGMAALAAHEDWLPGNVRIFRERRDAAVANLRSSGFEVTAPPATMYLWVPLPTGIGSAEFARRLLHEQGVAVMPGVALGKGGEGFFRIALTVPEKRIREATARIGRIVT